MKRKISVALSLTTIISLMLTGCSGSSTAKEIDSQTLLQNKDARLAINMAIDNSMLVDEVIKNGSVASDMIVPKNLAINEKGEDYRGMYSGYGYEHNDEKAKEHWDKAKEELGFESIELDLITNDDDTGKITAEFIQSELQSTLDGLTIEIRPLPSKQKIDAQINHDFDLANNAWIADFPDPLDFLGIFTTNGFFGNRMQYNNEEYDTLVEEAKMATTTDEAWDVFAKAEELLLEDGVIDPLYQRGKVHLQKDYVKDVIEYGFGVKTSYRYTTLTNDSKDLRVTADSDIPTIDLSKATDSTSFLVIGNTMEGLVTLDKESNVIPAVAKEWTQSEDGKTWTFKLRDDATWSNGEKVTAHDFEYSWKRTLNPDTSSQYGYIFNDIVGAEDYNTGKVDNADGVGVKALDDTTLEVKLNRRVNYFDKLMVFPVFYPQSEAFVESHKDTYGTSKDDMLYNGAYTLSEWKMEDSFTLTKNENYREKDDVYLDNIHHKVSKEANTSINLYEDNQVDRVSVTSEFADKYKGSKELISTQESGMSFIMMNVGE